MILVFLSDALSLASIKATKEDRRYAIEAVRRKAGDYGYQVRAAALNEHLTYAVYVEPDGTVVRSEKVLEAEKTC